MMMERPRFFLLLVLTAGVTRVASAQVPMALFEKRCTMCHKGAKPAGKLRLDTPEHIAEGGSSGQSLALLVDRVSATDKSMRMPPVGEPLSAEEIAVLKQWVAGGAKGLPKVEAAKKHWAYVPPVQVGLPTVRGASRNAVDQFVLARLEKQGLGFQPEASRQTLIRRLSLDLTGLPPTPKEVAEFLADERVDAYERVVERLLASPHYGERWARPWLDLARYADTNGYEKDERRTMWKYRDWVIEALNKDMPFDQFTIEQIAGDLLPNATVEQKIATGFHRNTMLNEEGGVDRDEAHFEVMVDRVNTTGSVWLGSTLGCTQCHNHKYDPFTQKDYYSMMAFFSNEAKTMRDYGDTSTKWVEPQLDLATPQQEAERQRLRAKIDKLDATLKTSTSALEAEQAAWERASQAAKADWAALSDAKATALHGTVLAMGADGDWKAAGENPREETYQLLGRAKAGNITGLRIEALPDKSLPRGGPGRDTYGNFILSEIRLEVRDGGDWKAVEWARQLSDDGRVGGRQLWVVDASREDQRLARQLVLVAKTPVTMPASGAEVRVTIRQDSEYGGQSLGRFRVTLTGAADPSTIVKVRARIWPILDTPLDKRTEEQKREVAAFFRTIAPSLASAREELRGARGELDRLGIVTALVMASGPADQKPCDFTRTRGGYANKAVEVCADVPAALGALPKGAPRNRMGLAQWLASKDNPLTARVAVNRRWEQYFGRGLVETSEDFGTQGERPTHPELLDWLAVEFMNRGWSYKALDRLIVMSAAYRQSSNVTPELLREDPYNKLISRGAKFRLEAELVRDFTLSASGLLSAKIGGPSVFPYQPEGVWDVPYSSDRWQESKGEDRYRRGVYTFVRRSALYPSMMNFDATSREVCTVRRVRTNTPLQALTGLNDPAFFEGARALAKRLAAEGGSTLRDRVGYAYQLVASRAPKPAETDRMLGWLETETAYFRAHPAEAEKVAGDAESAAWTMLANVLLNLDEAVTRH